MRSILLSLSLLLFSGCCGGDWDSGSSVDCDEARWRGEVECVR